MNANELADDLENWFGDAGFDEHVAMLRTIPKLQAEIEALKNRNWELVSEPWGFDRCEAKTLTDAEQDACFNRGYKEGARDILNKPAKTLTDEEIDLVWKITPSYEDRPDHINFARAILRKAQEK